MKFKKLKYFVNSFSEKRLYFLFFLQMMLPEIENPWNVKSLYEFQYFNCPTCPYKNFSKQDFVNHAFDAHPKSKYYFMKISNHNSFNDVQLPPDNIADKMKVENIAIFPETTSQTIVVKSELDDYRESLEGKAISDCHEQSNLIDDPLGTYELSIVKTEEIELNDNEDFNYYSADPEKLLHKTKQKGVHKKQRGGIKEMTYSELITEALSNAPDGELTLSGICMAINGRHPRYKMDAQKWQHNVRQYLSINKAFTMVSSQSLIHNSNSYWRMVKPDIPVEYSSNIPEYNLTNFSNDHFELDSGTGISQSQILNSEGNNVQCHLCEKSYTTNQNLQYHQIHS